MNLKKLATIFVVMGALILILAACGSDDPVPTKEGVVVESTPTIETPGEAPPAPTVETPGEAPPAPTVETPGQVPTTPKAEQVVFDLDVCAVTEAAQLPIEFQYAGTVPPGFDDINKASCTFTKPVKTVTVSLIGAVPGTAPYTETFTFSGPATQVSFPLPQGTPSISTFEIVPPADYQRKMTVTSVDGEMLLISDQPEVLKTVTILEPQV